MIRRFKHVVFRQVNFSWGHVCYVGKPVYCKPFRASSNGVIINPGTSTPSASNRASWIRSRNSLPRVLISALRRRLMLRLFESVDSPPQQSRKITYDIAVRKVLSFDICIRTPRKSFLQMPVDSRIHRQISELKVLRSSFQDRSGSCLQSS